MVHGRLGYVAEIGGLRSDPLSRERTVGFRIHAGSLTATGSLDGGEFVRQMRVVLDRHLPKTENRSKDGERVARASIAVNAALASAARREITAACRVRRRSGALLGPGGIKRYFRDSRIVERLLPRVRAKLRRSLNMAIGPLIRKQFGRYERQFSDAIVRFTSTSMILLGVYGAGIRTLPAILEVGCGEGVISEIYIVLPRRSGNGH